MKRIALIIALTIAVLSFGVSAEKMPHWEGFMEIPQIGQPLNHGEIGIRVQPFEFNNGAMLVNGVEGQLFFQYGIGAKTELNINLADTKSYYGFSTLSEKMAHGSLKHKLIDQNGFALSVLGELTYTYYPQYDSHNWTPVLGLLSGKILDKNLKFNNNAYFTFYPTGNVGITLENGLAYVITPTNIVKARLETYMVDLDGITHNVKVAYRSHINNQLNYTLLIDKTLGAANTNLANIFEFKPASDLKFTANYIFNTHRSHRIQARVEKVVAPQVTLVGEYDKQLKYDGYSSLVTGVNLTF